MCMKSILFLFFLLPFNIVAQTISYHEQLDTSCAFGTNIYQTPDGGSLILVGDVYHSCKNLTRLDHSGQIVWTDVFDAVDDLIVMPDSSIICSGIFVSSLVIRKLDN